MNNRTSTDTKWLCETPIHSDVEAKLRGFLVESANSDRILGIQVCAYKDGKVIIDTAAGVMGKDDPRPVQLDTLFPVFSATKGVTAGMIHWLADKGILKLDENIANFWPEFAVNGKDKLKVHHVLDHTSGLHNALAGITEDHVSFCDWDECLKRIAMATPETEPGSEQFYHYLSYGWLCGGIIEHASGKKFKDILEEAFVRPLNVEGELFIGIPSNVESRLATSSIDTSEFISSPPPTAEPPVDKQPYAAMPSSLVPAVLPALVNLCNIVEGRRAIVPAANGNCSARALARYYAALVDGGTIPSPHSSTTDSHTTAVTKIFNNPKSKIHDAFLGTGDYKDLALPDGKFGLGFKRIKSTEGLMIGFGHAGLGGSTGYGDINNRFSISVTVNNMSFMAFTTAEVIRFVCSELDLPVPEDYAGSRQFHEKPVIN
ncbi:uncharacterized protein LOC111892451 [Lactuca sativa]|uniref:Beta-lactamase-related domain-containing protein n=1 Tax=Lactuca sativa TaxID=4236 RepID=A0A9R1VCS7_LACSA|nr:uncharacterized protein LOC111892451 [Lactuca sativa]KAJ0203780.1 hypothetical protein LSAT_V11C500250130 [Lactuca sativa]